jgi:hypothetical protein
MLCSSCGRGLPDGGLRCDACGAPAVRSGGTGVPALALSLQGTSGTRPRRRSAPLAVGVILLITGAVGVPWLMGLGLPIGTAGGGDESSDDTFGGNGTYDDGIDDTFGGDGGIDDGIDSTGTDDTYDPPVYEPPGDVTTIPPEPEGTVVVPYSDVWANGVESTLGAYFDGINTRDAQWAWMQLTPSWQERVPLDDLAEATRTTQDSDFVVQQASYSGGRADVWLEFTSTQDPELGPNQGEACTVWSLDYVLLELGDGTFLIDEVTGHGGTSGHSPC